MFMKMQAIETVSDGKPLFYVDLGFESDYQFRLFVDKSFLSKEDDKWFFQLPIIKCDVMQTDNNKDIIVKPGNLNMFYFYIMAGDKGKSVIDCIDTDQPYQVFKFVVNDEYNKMVSTGALIFTSSDKVKIKWHRNGRLYFYSPAKGTTLLHADGKMDFISNNKVVK